MQRINGPIFYGMDAVYSERKIMSIDVSKIRPGDEVTIAAVVAEKVGDAVERLRCVIGDSSIFIMPESIATHTPTKPLATYDEFAALPEDARRRWFDEFVKPKRRTVEDWMRQNDFKPYESSSASFWLSGPNGKAYGAVASLREALLKLKLIDE